MLREATASARRSEGVAGVHCANVSDAHEQVSRHVCEGIRRTGTGRRPRSIPKAKPRPIRRAASAHALQLPTKVAKQVVERDKIDYRVPPPVLETKKGYNCVVVIVIAGFGLSWIP